MVICSRPQAACFTLILVWAPLAAADEGMWLLTSPPRELLRERYGFSPSPEWLEHVQKSAVRIGASGSLVSGEGLLLTNHHVADDQLQKLSTKERNLLKTGFYAATREQELRCPDLEVKILWSIEDVTQQVNAAAKPGQPPAEAHEARRREMTRLEQQSKDATGLDSEIVTLYHGARYHLYRYKRYDDVRLVMAPEQGIAFFGQDTDNFEYPRFNLDCCFFRIYENGKPLRNEHYLRWSREGGRDGELMFVFGHPGRTDRQLTVDHLEFMRDTVFPATLNYLWREEVKLRTFSGRDAEHARMAHGDLLGVQNSRKARTGGYAGLLDPAVFEAKRKEEQRLRGSRQSEPDPWVRIARAQETYKSFYNRHRLLRGGRPFTSDLYGIAFTLVRLAEELPKPSPERLREYRDSELESVYLSLYSPAPIYEELEIHRMAGTLTLLAEELGADDPLVVRALDGKSPEQRALELVRGCTLKDIETRKRLAKEGKAAIEASKDPLIRLAAALDPEARVVRKRYEDEVESVEREAYAQIGAARFALFGESVYPDATGTLRMAFGPIKGFEELGRPIAPFTTFEGLYRRWQERQGDPQFELPKSWIDRRDRLKPDTPFNFVLTADIIGGNSGSPVVNRAGELTGLIFDGNIQSLILDFVYTEEQARAVAVDSRAILEALDKIYDAKPLVQEILQGSTQAGGAGKPDAEARVLFDGRSLNGWKVLQEGVFSAAGKVAVQEGALVLERGQRQTGVAVTGDFPREDYEVTLEARRVEGSDFFCGMTFPVGTQPCTLILGGWGGSVVGLSNVDGMSAAENMTTQGINFENGRWYGVRLRVTREKIQAWLDDEQVIDLPRENRTFSVWFEQEQCKPFGFSTWDTTGALRNIRVKSVQ